LQTEKAKSFDADQQEQVENIKAIQNEKIELMQLDQQKELENIKAIQNEQIKLHNSKIKLLQADQLKQVENIKSLQNEQIILQKLQYEKMKSFKTDQIKQENIKVLQLLHYKLKNGETESLLASIVDDLMDEKIIEDENELSFELTNDGLIVNGTQQPADTHQKLKKKYLNKAGDFIKYKNSKKSGSRSTNINKE
jgi:hypothetical protein